MVLCSNQNYKRHSDENPSVKSKYVPPNRVTLCVPDFVVQRPPIIRYGSDVKYGKLRSSGGEETCYYSYRNVSRCKTSDLRSWIYYYSTELLSRTLVRRTRIFYFITECRTVPSSTPPTAVDGAGRPQCSFVSRRRRRCENNENILLHSILTVRE